MGGAALPPEAPGDGPSCLFRFLGLMQVWRGKAHPHKHLGQQNAQVTSTWLGACLSDTGACAFSDALLRRQNKNISGLKISPYDPCEKVELA